jgi:hypothetical protein
MSELVMPLLVLVLGVPLAAWLGVRMLRKR